MSTLSEIILKKIRESRRVDEGLALSSKEKSLGWEASGDQVVAQTVDRKRFILSDEGREKVLAIAETLGLEARNLQFIVSKQGKVDCQIASKIDGWDNWLHKLSQSGAKKIRSDEDSLEFSYRGYKYYLQDYSEKNRVAVLWIASVGVVA